MKYSFILKLNKVVIFEIYFLFLIKSQPKNFELLVENFSLKTIR